MLTIFVPYASSVAGCMQHFRRGARLAGHLIDRVDDCFFAWGIGFAATYVSWHNGLPGLHWEVLP